MNILLKITRILLKIVQYIFIIQGSILLWDFFNNKYKIIGLFLGGCTFYFSAILSFQYNSWWPLLAGFIIAWILRLLGFDPGY